MRIEFTGSSDDLIYVTVDGAEREYMVSEEHCYAGHCFIVHEDQNLMAVHAIYDGCWSFAPALAEEDALLPDVTITCLQEHPYSVRLVIDGLPEGSTVEPGGRPLWKP